MRKIGIVMDSTGYLTKDILEEYQINVVPLNVNVGEETFPETELTNKTYFERMSHIPGLSTTSQPSVGRFLEMYKSLFSKGVVDIVSIHISSAISGTLHSAQMAKELASSTRIHIFDSKSSALGLGVLAWAAAEWAEQGLSALEIMNQLQKLEKQTELYFIVNTLENLRKGGRIGGAAALLGTLLQIKPILYFNKSGQIDVFDKVRSKSRAWQRVREELDRAISSREHYRICVMHVNIPEEGMLLLRELKKSYPEHEVRLFEAGPVIATHVGTGAFGLVFHPWPKLN
ncbi:EDD domain protein, DegV family [Desulfosporosinus orientis DSM 765]|uniref:EDD domain protein, DegV family n=1 Tax=Desulfosporosinus orientis (strain ATCC 19365 / DSM 765 / NCIMB 8382 / VKM B-1628 / Singapore I) TaxID=768706 RepID=G7WBM1_DESOD|nr:DegV family protein [Desulfosporosinus orientis]AET68779.1 EDD domain protein, DegV family [Desulfosporosinus orientis DSM 765]